MQEDSSGKTPNDPPPARASGSTDRLLQRKLALLEAGDYESFKRLQDEFHRKTGGAYIGDVIFAANDGIVTTFAVVAGATGGGLPTAAVLILGFSNLLADGLSMGLGNYLGSKSQREYEKDQRAREAYEIERFEPIEVAEVEHTFREWGFEGDLLDQAVKVITSDKKRWIDFMMRNELDIIEDPIGSPAMHGLVTFVSFAIAGLLPLIPFLFSIASDHRFILSIAATGASLFAVGALRTLITMKNWLRAGLEMLFVGSIAAAAAYFVGDFIEHLISG
jgi:VIT1/CCC1 family predicted Fe2+/Mn2+ transporter